MKRAATIAVLYAVAALLVYCPAVVCAAMWETPKADSHNCCPTNKKPDSRDCSQTYVCANVEPDRALLPTDSQNTPDAPHIIAVTQDVLPAASESPVFDFIVSRSEDTPVRFHQLLI